ncbi:apolipoprotein N-acyltransferase [Terricaulis silvestris]|uniref:Apolipoprotein N-acyltransferase n=1 Tax=Terricaulis silvestris TaxID=2686094 RepID=A0A6I6N0U0_9CAUL|nr:apolipoprotein N-acyltransferase [Terricaulis silvestris]QGZ96953.1 Apolipoprotein N-acyltransferase [Terricaulis silvestris]
MTTTSAQHSRIQNWFAVRTPWQRRGIALVAGAAATLGHAPFQLTPIYIAALVVLVWLLDAASTSKSRFGSAFTQGWWFALGHFATGLYWIASAFLVDADTWGIGAGVAAVIALAGSLALFWGAGCLLAIAFWTSDLRRAAVFAVSLFVVEWLRGNILTGFPWLLPGYVWTPGEPVSQLASLVGIYGLSLLTLLVAGAVATVADGQASAGRRFAPMIGVALVLGLIFGWGAQRTGRAPINLPGSELPFVRVADSGLSQAEKWRYRPDQEWRVLQRYLEVTGTQDESRAAIVIWPEGAIPTLNFFTLDNPEFLNAIGAALGDRALVTGITRCEPQPGCDAFMRGEGGVAGLRLYNSAAVIDGVSGVPRLSQTYDKYHLVPFGEYIPFWSTISQFNIAPLQRIGAGFTPGDRPTRLIIPEAPPAIVLICYEAIFPGLTPRGDERPGWIISVTNDAWFGNGSGPYQHFAMARYRAIEEGLPMARAAAGGISGIIDAYGRDIRSTRRVGAATEAQLPLALDETAFALWGNWLLLLLVSLIAALRFAPVQMRGTGRRE